MKPESTGDVMKFQPVFFLLTVYSFCCDAFQCSSSPYTTQVQQYITCPSGNEDEKSYIADPKECDRISIIPFDSCDSSLPTRTVPAELCWHVQNTAIGTVEVTLPLLPHLCNITRYDVTLMVHESSTCPSSTDIAEFKIHSYKEIPIGECTRNDCSQECSRKVPLVFHHVFTACYQLYVAPLRSNHACQPVVSEPLEISTEHIKTPINSLPPSITPLHNDLTLKIRAPIAPASAHVTVMSGINTTLDHNGCRLTGNQFLKCFICMGSKEIHCKGDDSDTTSLTTCSYQEDNVVRCTFAGMKPGDYCVRIQYDDERCTPNSVWNNISDVPLCTWDTFGQYIPSLPSVLVDSPKPTVHPALLVLLVSAVIAACALAGIVLYHRIMPNHPQFLPVQNKTPHISEQPIILLLYARDCPPFMQAVVQLRTVMRRLHNCQVMDLWEDSQYHAVAQSPSRWLQSLLGNSRVRCVLVTSPASYLLETAFVRNAAVMYNQPREFDKVLTLALTTLHETCLQDSYKRLFVVRFDTGGEVNLQQGRTHLNPLITYVLPVHLNKLMSMIHNLDSTLCLITTDGHSEVAYLADSIAEYQRYLADHPRYLDKLMVSESGTPVYHMLTQ